MPYRKIIFAQDQIYHIFNRGVAGMPIFSTPRDYSRFIELVNYYRFTETPTSFSTFKKVPVEDRKQILKDLERQNNLHIQILAFCLMPNHFHFLIRQISLHGIKSFMTHLQNSCAKYFNIKNERVGPLFQAMFNAVRIETEEQLLHVSRYIHLNPSTAYIADIADLINYQWSSLADYLVKDKVKYSFVDQEIILGLIGGKDQYKNFIFDQAEYQRELGNIKHLIME